MTTTLDAIDIGLTTRQLHALSVLVQQRAMQVDTLAAFLGTGRNHVYELLTELRRLDLIEPGLVRVGGAPGGGWIVPNQDASELYFGHRLRRWTPSRLWSVHGRAVNHVRLALGARDIGQWRPAHEIDLDNPGTRYPGHGEWTTRRGNTVAVVVDTRRYTLTPSKLSETVHRTMHQVRTDWCTNLLWVCAGATTTAAVRTTIGAYQHQAGAHDGAQDVAVYDYTDLTDPNRPVLTPWGVA